MVPIRPYRPDELPVIVGRATQTSVDQLVTRQQIHATRENVAKQVALMFYNTLSIPDGALFVADWPLGLAGDGPAGHILLLPQPDAFMGAREIVVMDIYTHPTLRGRRVGRALLNHAEAYARTKGCQAVVAQVAFHNLSSFRMFSGSGYQPERQVMGKRL